jgi:predicted O-linked N-acetylglucosamine transferase (SPINDLY family)
MRDPDRRIRIGYVSADYRNHSAALAFRPVLLNHDKAQFEITCYSSTRILDGVTAEFQRAADRWRDVTRISDDALCERVQADGINILVDLSGHSAGTRLGVFARKPAPVQVTAWGHATGTGLPTIDYLFSDPVACPPEVRGLFAEKIFDLPCLISIDPLPEHVMPAALPMLSNGYVTFGVFNRPSRISDEAAALWARILDALPSSRLLMKHGGFDLPSTQARLLERFAAHGIAAERIAFRGATPRLEHFAAFNAIDIALDPFPNSGGISTWEPLQMGVPVVAKLGQGIGGRTAGAILSAVGMTDWVANTTEVYFAIAMKFAAMPEHLDALRRELPLRLADSAAGNSVKYTRAVEAAYRTMWADYCRDTAV